MSILVTPQELFDSWMNGNTYEQLGDRYLGIPPDTIRHIIEGHYWDLRLENVEKYPLYFKEFESSIKEKVNV